MAAIAMTPIGTVRSSVTEPIDDVFGGVISHIELDRRRFKPDCLAGLAEYSHIEVVFLFHRLAEKSVELGARHPRGRKDWPCVGVFAQRGKARPNRLGVTVCKLIGVEGLTVTVESLDAIDGTPVLDIKPYVREFGPRGEVRQPSWITELMSTYWQ
jgi:tRNA-Thr(GGU) m(6)t(6)A37 methyltransferase TsaA